MTGGNSTPALRRLTTLFPPRRQRSNAVNFAVAGAVPCTSAPPRLNSGDPHLSAGLPFGIASEARENARVAGGPMYRLPRRQEGVKNVKRNWLATVAGLLFLVSAIPERAAAQVSYTITDLGTLGGDNSIPYWITNTGEVVGVSDTGQFDAFGNPVDHAFRWVGGPLQDLQTLGGNDSSANGANAEGQAVGIADVTGGSTSHAVLWQGGTMADLGALNGPSGFSFAQLVNGS